ncbi:nucleoside-diphosphate sugar epimerase/dehydratase [uncultured Sunxiuqinia sp.]|uniref:polysaccharide biosynthesis protein n=1 Tax=uncultured Sunxiuqinia sp. TaxID=1573825 RepID=UPI0026174DE1|nr:nucleoside-diphosphate sugar epimerase/dehydratase [uncultured Sunxiuqinia sp.]
MNTYIRSQIHKRNLPRKLVLITDLFMTMLALMPAYLLRFNFDSSLIDSSGLLGQQLLIILPIYALAFIGTGSYRGVIRHSSIQDASRLAGAVLLATVLTFVVVAGMRYFPVFPNMVLPYSVILIHALLISVTLMGGRMLVRALYEVYVHPRKNFKKVLIFGAGEMGKVAQRIFESDRLSRSEVVGFIDDHQALQGKLLGGKLIYSEKKAFKKLIKKGEVEEIIFAINRSQITKARKKEVLDRCLKYKVNIREVPPVDDWINGKLSLKQIREVRIEDLLGRDPIWLDQQTVATGLKGKVVLVTGAAGSIGSEIVRQLMGFELERVILLDQAESALYDLQNELQHRFPGVPFEVVVASVTNPSRMRQVFERFHPQYVFHASAYKHVPLMEEHPTEAIQVNIGGTRLVANLSVEFGVKKFVMVSTDKAVNPTNVMGTSKRICEIYIQALTQSRQCDTQFITTRFGNVLGSNGSVVPLFRKQIESGGPVTVTHPDIIRYFMTIPEACQLVLEAGFMGRGGEIYVFDMGEPVKIYDLAVKMISLTGLKPGKDIDITFSGLRPGEKLYEELLADEENTIATHHPKIMAAKVRQHEFAKVALAISGLVRACQYESCGELVKRMRELVPEFIPQNEVYGDEKAIKK